VCYKFHRAFIGSGAGHRWTSFEVAGTNLQKIIRLFKAGIMQKSIMQKSITSEKQKKSLHLLPLPGEASSVKSNNFPGYRYETHLFHHFVCFLFNDNYRSEGKSWV
jgi:hypothetical protein